MKALPTKESCFDWNYLEKDVLCPEQEANLFSVFLQIKQEPNISTILLKEILKDTYNIKLLFNTGV